MVPSHPGATRFWRQGLTVPEAPVGVAGAVVDAPEAPCGVAGACTVPAAGAVETVPFTSLRCTVPIVPRAVRVARLFAAATAFVATGRETTFRGE